MDPGQDNLRRNGSRSALFAFSRNGTSDPVGAGRTQGLLDPARLVIIDEIATSIFSSWPALGIRQYCDPGHDHDPNGRGSLVEHAMTPNHQV